MLWCGTSPLAAVLSALGGTRGSRASDPANLQPSAGVHVSQRREAKAEAEVAQGVLAAQVPAPLRVSGRGSCL